MMFGFMDRNDDNVTNSSKYIDLTFGWIIIIMLAAIEFVLYLFVGCLSDKYKDIDELTNTILEGNFAEPF